MSNRSSFCFSSLEPKVQKIYEQVKSLKDIQSTLLITGASGSGKESLCHLLHASKPANTPLVMLNCAAIPDELVESELFGHVPGSFTGANSERQGKLAQARHGILVLDHIDEIPTKLQAKLLRVLEEKNFSALGSHESIPLEAFIIATTSRDLSTLVTQGKFRADLFYRLDVLRIEMPALSERRKDIPLLTDFIINKLNNQEKQNKKISSEVYYFLSQKHWDGNIRELENYLTRLYFTVKGNLINLNDLNPDDFEGLESDKGFQLSSDNVSLHELEKQFIIHTLQKMEGNKSRAARALKISLKTLRNKLKCYNYDIIAPDLYLLGKAGRPRSNNDVTKS